MLHYELADYGLRLPTRDAPALRAVHLGVTARRAQFAARPSKPPEGDVYSFDDVTFGAMGPNGRTTIGVGDHYIGYGRVTRF